VTLAASTAAEGVEKHCQQVIAENDHVLVLEQHQEILQLVVQECLSYQEPVKNDKE